MMVSECDVKYVQLTAHGDRVSRYKLETYGQGGIVTFKLWCWTQNVGRISLTAEGNHPAITIITESGLFYASVTACKLVQKPYSMVRIGD